MNGAGDIRVAWVGYLCMDRVPSWGFPMISYTHAKL
jgi:hypothetical protein